jgi:hypothetical protein
VPAGPLLVAPDLATGVPSGPATRSGRALALQLLAASLARRDGLAPDAIVIGALPDWLADEPDFGARAAAEIALRRALFPGHPMAFLEPAMSDEVAARWQAVVGALLADAGDVETILRRSPASAIATRGMAQAAASLKGSRVLPELTGVAVAHAGESVAAALQTLEALTDRGWQALVDQPLGIRATGVPDTVAERNEPFDPLAYEAVARV